MGNKKINSGGGAGSTALPAGPAAALCAAAGLGFRIPVFRRIGLEGIGRLAGPYFAYYVIWAATAWALASFLSGKTALLTARGRRRRAERLFRLTAVLSLLLGAAGGTALLLGAEWLTAGSPMERYSWESLAPAVFLLPCLGAVRGRLAGLGARRAAAASVIVEQAVGAAASLSFASSWLAEGQKSELVYETAGYAPAFGAAGGILGLGIGSAAALVFSLVFLFLRGARGDRRTGEGTAAPMPGMTAGNSLWAAAVCLAAGAGLILDRLCFQTAGQKGSTSLCMLTGLFLIFLASAFWSGPAASIDRRKRNGRKLREQAGRVLRLAAAAGAAGGAALIVLCGPGLGLLIPGQAAGFPGEAAAWAASVLLLTAGASQASVLFRLERGVLAAMSAAAALAVHGAGLAALVSAAGLGSWGLAAAHGLSSAVFFLLCTAWVRLLLGGEKRKNQ